MKQTIIMALMLMALVACGTTDEERQQQDEALQRELLLADSAALKIAVLPTLDCLPLFVAQDRHFFSQAGVEVRLRLYQAQMDADTALLRGWVEGEVTDLVRAGRMQRQGFEVDLGMGTAASWSLVTRRAARIKQLKALDDKMLAMTRYSATHLLSDWAVDSVALSSERVFRIQVNDVGVRLGMLESSIMDAMLLPEPQATQAMNKKHPILMDTRHMDLRLGALVWAPGVLGDSVRSQQVAAFVEAYNMACDSLNEHGIKAYGHLVEHYCGTLPSTTDTLAIRDVTFSHASPPREVDVKRANEWLNKNDVK